jgi:hypothetical protein
VSVWLQIDGKLPCGQGKYYFKSKEGMEDEAILLWGSHDGLHRSVQFQLSAPPRRSLRRGNHLGYAAALPGRLYGEESTPLLKTLWHCLCHSQLKEVDPPVSFSHSI